MVYMKRRVWEHILWFTWLVILGVSLLVASEMLRNDKFYCVFVFMAICAAWYHAVNNNSVYEAATNFFWAGNEATLGKLLAPVAASGGKQSLGREKASGGAPK
jgi:4-amino-4-deoxy-L-arabinose transferase-like glycosyltransferase